MRITICATLEQRLEVLAESLFIVFYSNVLSYPFGGAVLRPNTFGDSGSNPPPASPLVGGEDGAARAAGSVVGTDGATACVRCLVATSFVARLPFFPAVPHA